VPVAAGVLGAAALLAPRFARAAGPSSVLTLVGLTLALVAF
jgi:hypothetical protein